MYYLFLNGIAAIRSFVLLAGYGHLLNPVAHWYLTFEMCLSAAIFIQYYLTVLPPETRAAHQEKFNLYCVEVRRIAVYTKDECGRIVAKYVPVTAEYVRKMSEEACKAARSVAQEVKVSKLAKRMKENKVVIKANTILIKSWEGTCQVAVSVRQSRAVIRSGELANKIAITFVEMLLSIWQNLCHLIEALVHKCSQLKQVPEPVPEAEIVVEDVVDESAVEEVHIADDVQLLGLEAEIVEAVVEEEVSLELPEEVEVVEEVPVVEEPKFESTPVLMKFQAVPVEPVVDTKVEPSPVVMKLEVVTSEPEVIAVEDAQLESAPVQGEIESAVEEAEAAPAIAEDAAKEPPRDKATVATLETPVVHDPSDPVPIDAESEVLPSQADVPAQVVVDQVPVASPEVTLKQSEHEPMENAEAPKQEAAEIVIATPETGKAHLERQMSTTGIKKHKFLHFNSKIELL